MQQTELSELREQHESHVTELKTMADQWQEKGCNATDEEIVRYDSIDESIKGLAQSIATIERADNVKAYLNNPKRSEVFGAPVIKIKRQANRHDYDNAFKAWALGGHETRQRVRDDWKRSAELIDIDYESRDWITRDQTSDVDSEGGHFDNDSLYRGFVEARKAFGGMLEASHVVTVATAEQSHYATDDDTSNVAATHSQAESVTNVAVTVGRKSVTPSIYSSGVFPVSLQLIRDSKEDIGAWVARKLSRRILSKVNLDLTADLYTGTVEGETGFSTLTDAEDLYNLYFSCPSVYRNSPKTA